jgi:hypothetical protein
VKRLIFAPLILLMGCTEKAPPHPALSPLAAERLLHYDTRAQNRLKSIQKQDRTCDFKIQLPDQSTHPTVVEADHVVTCGGRNDLKAFDANAEFQWNKAQKRWELSHFGS